MNPNLTEDTINKNLRYLQLPWPSSVINRGNEIEQEIKMGKQHPFNEVFHVHSGDPQGLGQKPMTFIQETVSLCLNPSLQQNKDFPSDVKQRATTILRNWAGQSLGSYSRGEGMVVIRKQVAEFIQQRDGVPANYEDIFVSCGATDAIRVILYLFINNDAVRPLGVMIPIPEYPLFSSTILEYGMYPVNYYLNEETQWALDVPELRRAIKESRMHCEPKILVVINPGNSSGFVLSKKDMQNIVKFAYEENLFIMADEVYQYNVYEPELEFHSFKKIMYEMGAPYNKMQLASIMSGSKGYMGECGARSGYCEIVNMDCATKEILFKLLSAKLTPNSLGQLVMYCITNPPQLNEPSYKLYQMARNRTPDEFYAMEMLQNSGVCVLPGSLFGQKPGTYHFRFTFLSPMESLKEILEKMLSFHQNFMAVYKD